ncbi:hypothetical protein [Tenacibaculum finnmarkense]|uniref:hypothetical protein n=1 Tax=Tenacibaculum finnmarkense TaxID=2781243 RepID=UPI001E4120BE|nr:hypothetical protein [Tenacibaculum finnmarkense]MCD8444012.1 hypothetical protein [Tenacibaculum finnmarkense genomovar ulcerans]
MNIFCSNCGSALQAHQSSCGECGNSMNPAEIQKIENKLQKINQVVLVDDGLKTQLNQSFKGLDNYKLSSTYLMSGSAKDDLEEKVNYLKGCVLPDFEVFRGDIKQASTQLGQDKVQVYARIMGITEFVLREFFGPLAIKENNLQIFEEFRDFSEYELKETMIDYHLDVSDVQQIDFGTVGDNIGNAIVSSLKHGHFSTISDKKEFTKGDLKQVGTEMAVGVGIELLSAGVQALQQNSQMIKKVREADYDLTAKIDGIKDRIQSLEIEKQEIKKEKRLYDKCDVILDTCFEKVLKPVVNQLKANAVFTTYQENRKPYDLEVKRIKIDKEAQEKPITVSFWRTLLSSKSDNFIFYAKNRRQSLGKEKAQEYETIKNQLKQGYHNSLENQLEYEYNSTENFTEFEKINRRTLKALPVFVDNKQDVFKFAGVLKKIKTQLNTVKNG